MGGFFYIFTTNMIFKIVKNKKINLTLLPVPYTQTHKESIMATLIVIDMQDMFLNRKHRDLAHRINALIKLAKSKGDNIILVEYGERWYPEKPAQSTILSIRNAVRGYEHLYKVKKFRDDGSQVIMDLMRHHNLEGPIIACGVNTECCVNQTVTMLVSIYDMEMTVVDECCRNVYEDDPNAFMTAFQVFKFNSRINVVKTVQDAYELIPA